MAEKIEANPNPSLSRKLNKTDLSSFSEVIRNIPTEIKIKPLSEDKLSGDYMESTKECKLVIKFLCFKWTFLITIDEICLCGRSLQICKATIIEIDENTSTFDIHDSREDIILTFPLNILDRILGLLEDYVSRKKYESVRDTAICEAICSDIERFRERCLKKTEKPSE